MSEAQACPSTGRCQHQMGMLLVQLPLSSLLRPEVLISDPREGLENWAIISVPWPLHVGSSSCQEVKAGCFLSVIMLRAVPACRKPAGPERLKKNDGTAVKWPQGRARRFYSENDLGLRLCFWYLRNC